MLMRDVGMAWKLVTAPAAEPLTYAQAKAFLRLPNDTDQSWVTDLISVAREKVEGDTGKKLITQTWDVFLDAFPSDAILLPVEPLISVTSIKTTDDDGVETTMSSAGYQVDVASAPPSIVLVEGASWPDDLRAHAAIRITCSVGYGASGASVPAALKQAMYQMIALQYAPRAVSGLMPPQAPPRWAGYDALIAPYRVVRLA